MSKVIQVTVELKQGLPNYSSRAASVVIVADEGESLDLGTVIQRGQTDIKAAFEGKQTTAPVVVTPPPAPKVETKDEVVSPTPGVHVVKAPKPVPESLKGSAAAKIASSILDDE